MRPSFSGPSPAGATGIVGSRVLITARDVNFTHLHSISLISFHRKRNGRGDISYRQYQPLKPDKSTLEEDDDGDMGNEGEGQMTVEDAQVSSFLQYGLCVSNALSLPSYVYSCYVFMIFPLCS